MAYIASRAAGALKWPLGIGVSTLALIAATAASAQTVQTDPAAANSNDAAPANTAPADAEPAGDEIIVTGLRQSLASAQERKRNSDTFVDTISASDIGALPDRSIAESLQRVPGVTISRFAAGNDPSRFNAEGSAVLIRGLNKVRTEFNGRDAFNASVGDGRGLSFEDITPEVVGGVDVYKNQTADMIEGGIAGTINIRTRLPFDAAESFYSLSADLSRGDLRRGKPTFTFSGILSKRWDTSIGEIGIMLDFAYSKLRTRTDGVQVGEYGTTDALVAGKSLTLPLDTYVTRQDYDRTRQGRVAALQWRSPDDKLEATLQYVYSRGKEYARQRDLNLDTTSASNLRVYPGTSIETAGDRVTSGTFIEPNGFNEFYFYAPYPTQDQAPLLGPNFQSGTRIQRTTRSTADYSFNLKWKATDRLTFNADLQYVKSKRGQLDFTNSFLNKGTYSIDGFDGKGVPTTDFGLPFPGAPENYFQSPNGYIPFVAMDHIEDIQGRQYSGRLDATYDFEDAGWLDSVQAGVRYADQDQDAAWSAYNWGSINTFWQPGTVGYLNTQPNVQSEPLAIRNFAHTGQDFRSYLFPSISAVSEYYNYAQALSAYNAVQSQYGVARWYPAALRPGAVDGYLPAERNRTKEIDKAAYLRLNFAGDLFGSEFKANAGVRYVHYRNSTDGGIAFPTGFGSRPAYCTAATSTLDPADTRRRLTDPRCFIADGDYAFANGASGTLPVQKGRSHYFLPSANIRYELDRNMYLRFAVSKALSRPGLGLLRNYVNIQQASPRGFNSAGVAIDTIAACANIAVTDPLPAQCTVTTAILQNTTGTGAPYRADSAGNPQLKPETAWNFDLAYEWYFGQGNSLTVSAFYKRLKDTLQQGSVVRSYTNNGVSRDVVFNTLVNGGKATIKGFELGYQQFFTFLPQPLDGLGFVGNYTYIKSNGRTSAVYGGTGGGITVLSTGLDLPLLDLSKHNYNLIGIYQKYGVEARLAYTWRSKRLLTAQDSALGFPVFAASYGQLDASLFYNITKEVKLGIEGVNLLDSITRTTSTYSYQTSTQLPRGWFSNDRRYSVVVRATF